MTKIVLCGALFGLISLSAQDPETAAKKQLDEAAFKILNSTIINGPTVKGAPYSAQAVNEMVRMLADGNRITNNSTTTLYRDSQGRERREEAGGREIVITDPVEGASYTLMTDSKTARKNLQRGVAFTTSPGVVGSVGGGRGGAVTLTENRVFFFDAPGSGPEKFVFTNEESHYGDAQRKVEHLGTQVIEGVAAEGTRTTVTIPAGKIGNELPIVTVNERWYSPDLQVVVKNTRSDPRTGTSTYTLTNINRSEPSPAMFQVPSDYTINERRVVLDKEER